MRLRQVSLIGVLSLASSACVVRVAPPGGEVSVQQAPPAEQVEIIGVAPSPNHFWVKGHWVWRGAWVWQPGRWELVRHGHVWTHGEWVRRGHHWVWVEGAWR
jgi:hypothetical protein